LINIETVLGEAAATVGEEEEEKMEEEEQEEEQEEKQEQEQEQEGLKPTARLVYALFDDDEGASNFVDGTLQLTIGQQNIDVIEEIKKQALRAIGFEEGTVAVDKCVLEYQADHSRVSDTTEEVRVVRPDLDNESWSLFVADTEVTANVWLRITIVFLTDDVPDVESDNESEDSAYEED